MNRQKSLIVIAGPTAVGKTAVAIQLAQYHNTVIISADSRQFYRELSIGTAKPSQEELSLVEHYFINSHSVTESFSVGDYEKKCIDLLNNLFKIHDIVLLVGGSGLFIKAVCDGFDQLPPVNTTIREKLNDEYVTVGIVGLQEKLKTADPEYYQQVDLGNPQRVIRALEVFESTGNPLSSYHGLTVNKRPFRTIKFGLNMERELLYQRINERVDVMLRQGLIDEVKSLLPYRHLNALSTVGYSELFEYFDGKTDLDTAIQLIKRNTRRFAKRQLTWFGKDKEIKWIDAHQQNLLENILEVNH